MKSVSSYLLMFPDSVSDSERATLTTLEMRRVSALPSERSLLQAFPSWSCVTPFSTRLFPGRPPLGSPVFQYLLIAV